MIGKITMFIIIVPQLTRVILDGQTGLSASEAAVRMLNANLGSVFVNLKNVSIRYIFSRLAIYIAYILFFHLISVYCSVPASLWAMSLEPNSRLSW